MLPQLSLLSLKNILQISTASLKRQANPGIQNRLSLFKNDKQPDETDVDDLESDFLNLNTSYNSYIKEKEKQKRKLEFVITRQKYFQKKQPNFLFWQEKQQIRYLHNTNSDEWTVEKLSESFPALPDTITKIIKSMWRPESPQRIHRHDESVMENWNMLKQNKVVIDEQLKEHLNKFSIREPRVLSNVLLEKSMPNNSSDKTEFRDLITSRKDNETVEPKDNQKTTHIPYIFNNRDKFINKSVVTLDELKKHDQLINKYLNSTEQLSLIQSNTKVLVKKNNMKASEFNDKVLPYPEYVHIPKKLWKKGCTYKVNDCYYDDDGSFLYRTMGM